MVDATRAMLDEVDRRTISQQKKKVLKGSARLIMRLQQHLHLYHKRLSPEGLEA